MTVLERYLRWLASPEARCSAATVDGRRDILTRMDQQLPFGLERANADELIPLVYRDDCQLSSQETYYGALASFYARSFDVDDPWLGGDNPMRYMPPKPRAPRGIARPIEHEQLRRILTEAIEPYRLWSLIAAYQGLRCCEIAGLDREHITQERLLVVRGKGGKPRWHDTDPAVWEAVRDLPPGPIAIDPRTGERADRKYISIRSAVYFRRRLGMPGVALHRMRHWLGVTVQAAYRDARVTQEILGHASLQSTQIYTQATLAQQRAARETLPRFS
jgi:integrase/recombinase XerC